MFVISVMIGYLIGSFPTSFIMARALKGVDIRQVGSGNAGATNVLRSVGRLPALITLIVDVFKGIFVVTIIANFFYSYTENLDYDFYRSFLGFKFASAKNSLIIYAGLNGPATNSPPSARLVEFDRKERRLTGS